ncbi:hypothetical protein EBU94_08550 [bacterium]|nr:hypothetical protein [bacterium]
MKLNESQLKQIIKEELQKVLKEELRIPAFHKELVDLLSKQGYKVIPTTTGYTEKNSTFEKTLIFTDNEKGKVDVRVRIVVAEKMQMSHNKIPDYIIHYQYWKPNRFISEGGEFETAWSTTVNFTREAVLNFLQTDHFAPNGSMTKEVANKRYINYTTPPNAQRTPQTSYPQRLYPGQGEGPGTIKPSQGNRAGSIPFGR